MVDNNILLAQFLGRTATALTLWVHQPCGSAWVPGLLWGCSPWHRVGNSCCMQGIEGEGPCPCPGQAADWDSLLQGSWDVLGTEGPQGVPLMAIAEPWAILPLHPGCSPCYSPFMVLSPWKSEQELLQKHFLLGSPLFP